MQIDSLFAPQPSSPGLRGVINRYPLPIGAGVVIVALVSLLLSLHHSAPVNKSFYTDDDGVTYFSHAVSPPPFNTLAGREAVGAMVYSCDGGKTTFVGYLYRYTPEGKVHAEEMLRTHRAGPPMGMEVKRPKVGVWAPAMSHGPPGSTADGASIMRVQCPDGGSTAPFMINP